MYVIVPGRAPARYSTGPQRLAAMQLMGLFWVIRVSVALPSLAPARGSTVRQVFDLATMLANVIFVGINKKYSIVL
jgi:hypothetical protein